MPTLQGVAPDRSVEEAGEVVARVPTTKSTLKEWLDAGPAPGLPSDWQEIHCPHCGGILHVMIGLLQTGTRRTACCLYCYKTSWLPDRITGGTKEEPDGTREGNGDHAARG
jgi:hypothetical protein